MESLAKVRYGLKNENHDHQKDIVPVSLKISQNISASLNFGQNISTLAEIFSETSN